MPVFFVLILAGLAAIIGRLCYPAQSCFQWLEVRWPSEIKPEHAVRLLRQLAADQRDYPVVLEARATSGGVTFLFGVEQQYVDHLRSLTHSLIPGSDIRYARYVRRPPQMSVKIKMNTWQRALRLDKAEHNAAAILSSLVEAGDGEELVLQVMLGPRRVPLAIAPDAPSSAGLPLWRLVYYGKPDKVDTDKHNALKTKVNDHGFAATIRLGALAFSASRRRALLLDLASGLRTSEGPGTHLRLTNDRPEDLHNCRQPLRWPLRLNVLEMIAVTGWPLSDAILPGVGREGPHLLRADPLVPASGRIIARATAPWDSRLLSLSPQDALQHLHVLGPTGVGKSTLLLNMICQDIAAGQGTIVIDPKGDLIADVLARIPLHRQEDVVVLDPADSEAPVGLNPLDSTERMPELVAEQVLAIFHGLYADAWGPRTQDILHACLLTLVGRNDVSLCALPVLLTSPQLRHRIVGDLKDPVALEPFWAWYESISNAERQQAIAPVMNKLRAFLLRPRMRAVIGQTEPRFDMQAVFTEQKVLLISLAKGLLGSEASALLGSLVLARLWHTALSRIATPSHERQPVSVYIDEFQDYLHLPTDLAEILTQARGLGLSMTLANQHLSQLTAEVRDAVLANARSRVCFQLPHKDAVVMAGTSGGLLRPEDFEKLGLYEVYVNLVASGRVSGFASGKTLPPPDILSTPATIRSRSRNDYGRPLAEVEEDIASLLQPLPPATPVGRRNRRLS